MQRTEAVVLTLAERQRLEDELDSLQRRRHARNEDFVRSRKSDPVDAGVDQLQAEMTFLDNRIELLQGVLKRANIVDQADLEPGTIAIGSRVRVRWDDGEEENLMIAPPHVDLGVGWVSYESPVGQALIGRRTGDEIAVATPSGEVRVVVLAVEE